MTCILVLSLAESFKFVEELRQDAPSLIFLGALVIFSIIFLQNQIYLYMLPKKLREGFPFKRPKYDQDSFLKGSVAVSYTHLTLPTKA